MEINLRLLKVYPNNFNALMLKKMLIYLYSAFILNLRRRCIELVEVAINKSSIFPLSEFYFLMYLLIPFYTD